MNGNQSAIEQLDLRDLHAPSAPSAWPPAFGWWLLALLIVAALGWIGRRGWRHWRRAQRRERILRELDRLSATPCDPVLISAVSALLKRVALSRFPRLDVAALTGAEWLAFLDRTGGDGGFRHGVGRVLADGAYAPVLDCDAEALLRLARVWLRKNT